MKKLCSHCHVMLPLTSFHANKAQPDGLANDCRTCRRQYQGDWRERRRQEVRKTGIPLEYLQSNLEREPGPLRTDCWMWTGRLHEGGYGIVSYRGVEVRVHLGAWVGINGPKPEDYDLDHLCRQRSCFNPDHLELVTRKTNLNRGLGNKGEVNGRAILSHQNVLEIKKALKDNNGRGGSILAKKYGVAPATISNIKHGIIWKDVTIGSTE